MKIEVEMNEEMIIKILTEDAKTQVWHIHNTLHELSKKKEIYLMQDMKHHFETLQAFNMLLQYYGGEPVNFEQTDWKPTEDEGSFSSSTTVDELIYGTTKANEAQEWLKENIRKSEELDAEALGRFINNDATVEDMARAWASMDGKDDRFDKGKTDPEFDNTDGTYSGYCVEAREILERAANYAVKRES